jgi:hypothetical protein
MNKAPLQLSWNELNVLAACLEIKILEAHAAGPGMYDAIPADYAEQVADAEALLAKLRDAQRGISNPVGVSHLAARGAQ